MAMVAAEVYRQECKSDNRGGDEDFFVEHKPGKRPRSRQRAVDDSNSLAASVDEGDASRAVPKSGIPARKSYDYPTVGSSPAIQKSPSRSGSASRRRDQPRDVSPQRSGRAESNPRAVGGELMAARMELFRLGQDDVPQSEVRLNRALQDLQRQDQAIDGWKRQLQMMQQNLDDAVAELDRTKQDSKEKQAKATEIRARAAQDKKRMQDMYEKEAEENASLKSHVHKLQSDLSAMKVSMRHSRSESTGRSPEGASAGQIMSLKAEIVDLKSRLAEARAANIDDNSSLHPNPEVEELREKLISMERELRTLKQQELDVERLQQEHAESEMVWRDKLERLSSKAKKKQSELEASLQDAADEDSQLRTELQRVKANLQRLERERSRQRLHSTADVDRLTKQLADSQGEIASLKEQLAEQQREAHKASAKLREEVATLQIKLSAAKEKNSKSVFTAEDKAKLDDTISRLREEVESLKEQLVSKTETITSQSKLIAELEKKRGMSSGNMRKLAFLEEAVKFHKSNENTLRAELEAQRKILLEERALAASRLETREDALPQAPAHGSSALDQFRRKLQFFKAEEERATADPVEAGFHTELAALEKNVAIVAEMSKSRDDSNARVAEATHKTEVSVLQSKLCESEAMCKEEKARAEEERRISQENERMQAESIEELRNENEKYVEEKMILRQELEELRKQLAHLTSPGNGEADSAMEMDTKPSNSNVMRLRNELALARARLAAARDQTRHVIPMELDVIEIEKSPSIKAEDSHMEDTVDITPTPPSDDSVVSNDESCWAPPALGEGAIPTVITPDRQVTSTFQDYQSSEVEESWLSMFDNAHQEATESVASSGSKQSATDLAVEQLRRKLEESNARLEQASHKLNSLFGSSSLQKALQSSPSQKHRRDEIIDETASHCDVVSCGDTGIEVETFDT